jgi:hypothetical protein
MGYRNRIGSTGNELRVRKCRIGGAFNGILVDPRDPSSKNDRSHKRDSEEGDESDIKKVMSRKHPLLPSVSFLKNRRPSSNQFELPGTRAKRG